jgi:hypothetical protein
MATEVAPTPTLERTFRGHKDVVLGVSFSPTLKQVRSCQLRRCCRNY